MGWAIAHVLVAQWKHRRLDDDIDEDVTNGSR